MDAGHGGAVHPGHVIAGPDRADAAPLILLHKTGGDERELQPLACEVAPGRTIVALRGEVEEEGRLRFFRRVGPGQFDEADLKARAEALARRLPDILAGLHARRRPVALGLSNGANMLAALLLLAPRLLAGAALLRPACPFAVLPDADLGGLPVLLMAGSEDTTVTRDDTDRLHAHLSRAGAVVLRHDVTAGHRLVPGETGLIRSWFEALPRPVAA